MTREELIAEVKKLRSELIMQTALAESREINAQEYKRQYGALLKDFEGLIINLKDSCEYCKHHQPCDGKKCEHYIEGRGVEDNKNCHYDWQWSCQDFNFGECPKLENTLCNGCIQNNMRGFKWRGVNNE